MREEMLNRKNAKAATVATTAGDDELKRKMEERGNEMSNADEEETDEGRTSRQRLGSPI